MLKKELYIGLLLVVCLLPLSAQYYETGQDPSSLKWETIKTEHLTFIFPATYRLEAVRASHVYENSYSLLAGSLNEPAAKRFPIVIHSHSIESNGFVAWAPRRMELFPLPPQDMLPMDHHQQLALHELTHLIQMQSLRRGISKPFSYILGEQYTGALAIMTPFWFLEGNAVVNESIYSYSGRGRSPAFEKQFKAQLLEGEASLSYDKMINGSFRDFTPNHYEFGYQMSAWALSSLGNNVWSDALEYTSYKPFTLNPFNFYLRKSYGITKKGVYKATAEELIDRWKKEEEEADIQPYDTLNPGKRGAYISYYSPQIVAGGNILAIRTMLSRTPELVTINRDSGKENILCAIGYTWPARISHSNGLVTWAENRSDPRWENRGYSIVRTLSLATGEIRSISRGTRYFSPSLSHKGNRIVVSESTPDYSNSLVIIDSGSGTVVEKTSPPGNILPLKPVWSEDDSRIVFISYSDEGEGIMSYDAGTGRFTTILPAGRDDLESLAVRGDTIFFTSSSTGIDNIFAINSAGEIFRLTSVRFGVSDISVSGDKLLFADYTSSGNTIAEISISSTIEKHNYLKKKSPLSILPIDSSVKPEDDDHSKTIEEAKIEPYRKALHLFNFHSWMPFWTDVNNISAENLSLSPGLTLMSQNHLSTMISTLGYEYSGGDNLFHSTISWKGWYPALDLDMTWGGTPSIIQSSSQVGEPSVIFTGLRATGTLYLPLHFNSGRFNQTLWPSVRLAYNNNYVYLPEESSYDYGQTLASLRLFFANTHRMAVRDIWPRWGQIVDINHTFSPGDKELYGPVTSLRSTFYFPGLAPNHSIRINAQFEKKEFRKLLITNRITLPRGYNSVIPEKASVYTIDYSLPLLYPDFNLGPILYLQRIRGALFYDFANTSENYYYLRSEMVHGTEIFRSYGAELLSDFYLLRIPFRFSAGVQAAWLPDPGEPSFKLIFNMDVFGFVLGRDKAGY